VSREAPKRSGAFGEEYQVGLVFHRIRKIDEIEGFPGEDGADWYYHVGFSEDGVNYYWEASEEPYRVDDDDIIIDNNYYFTTSQTGVYVAILVCEDDFWSHDDLADASSDSAGGQDNVAASIQPPSSGILGGTYSGYYRIPDDTLMGDAYDRVGDWYKTGGDYDGNPGDENDVEIWFALGEFEDIEPPAITLTAPEDGWIYFNGSPWKRFLITLIIGAIEIDANAFDESGIDQVEFYIDDELLASDTSFPYRCSWDQPAFFTHTITARAYDLFGNTAQDELLVWKFF
jgi:hypothetical protein